MSLFKILTGAGTKFDPIGLWGDGGRAENAAKARLTAAQAATEQARKLAEAQALATSATQKEYEQSLRDIATNAAKISEANASTADMGNITNVIAGGTADALTRKKKKAETLSSQLGINV
jgi:hypothetical protein